MIFSDKRPSRLSAGRSSSSSTNVVGGKLKETAEEIDSCGGKGVPVVCDHSKDDQVKAVFDRIKKEQGKLDVLVNNAYSAANVSMTIGLWLDDFLVFCWYRQCIFRVVWACALVLRGHGGSWRFICSVVITILPNIQCLRDSFVHDKWIIKRLGFVGVVFSVFGSELQPSWIESIRQDTSW